jgi:hypothetical protein
MLTADFAKFIQYAAVVRAGGRLCNAEPIKVNFDEAVESLVMSGYY